MPPMTTTEHVRTLTFELDGDCPHETCRASGSLYVRAVTNFRLEPGGPNPLVVAMHLAVRKLWLECKACGNEWRIPDGDDPYREGKVETPAESPTADTAASLDEVWAP